MLNALCLPVNFSQLSLAPYRLEVGNAVASQALATIEYDSIRVAHCLKLHCIKWQSKWCLRGVLQGHRASILNYSHLKLPFWFSSSSSSTPLAFLLRMPNFYLITINVIAFYERSLGSFGQSTIERSVRGQSKCLIQVALKRFLMISLELMIDP